MAEGHAEYPTSTRPRATAAALDDWLKHDPDLDFPASKAQIVAALERVGAPDDVLASVRAIPVDDYENRALVVAAADVEPGFA